MLAAFRLSLPRASRHKTPLVLNSRRVRQDPSPDTLGSFSLLVGNFPMRWFLIGKCRYTEIKALCGNVPVSGNLSWENCLQTLAGAFRLRSVSKGAPDPASPSPGRASMSPPWHGDTNTPVWIFFSPPLGPLSLRVMSLQSKVMRLILGLINAVTLRDADPLALWAGHYLRPQGRADGDVKPHASLLDHFSTSFS